MAQLLVRNLPDEVKERLKERARRHGHSLEAEVRRVLSDVPEIPPMPASEEEGWATRLARQMQQIGVTDEDVDELERSIAEGRKAWRSRPVEFDQ